MTNDKKLVPCEFGCGTKIYNDPVLFSDGLKLYIPMEEADMEGTDLPLPHVHNCPKLWVDGPGEFDSLDDFLQRVELNLADAWVQRGTSNGRSGTCVPSGIPGGATNRGRLQANRKSNTI